jgi:ATP-dependent DNA ligase
LLRTCSRLRWTSYQLPEIIKAMLPKVQPINPTRIAAPFDHDDFVFELKHDGFRALAYIEDGSCRLISRKQIQYRSFATRCGYYEFVAAYVCP